MVKRALGRVFRNLRNFFIAATTGGSRLFRDLRARAIQFGGMFPRSVNSAREGNPFADSNNFASRGINTSNISVDEQTSCSAWSV
jgi:hypothetical protein